MNENDFNAMCMTAVAKLRELAPKDTGHLAFNAIKGVKQSPTHYKIYIDSNVLINEPNIKGRVANYDYQTRINEDPKYRTYKWFDKAAEVVAETISKQINGVVKK